MHLQELCVLEHNIFDRCVVELHKVAYKLVERRLNILPVRECDPLHLQFLKQLLAIDIGPQSSYDALDVLYHEIRKDEVAIVLNELVHVLGYALFDPIVQHRNSIIETRPVPVSEIAQYLGRYQLQ